MSEEQRSTLETSLDAESETTDQHLHPDNSTDPEIQSVTEPVNGTDPPPTGGENQPAETADQVLLDDPAADDPLSIESTSGLEDEVLTERTESRIGYTGEILGDIVHLSSLNEQQQISEKEKEQTDHLTHLIDSSMNRVSSNEIVTGHVISVGEKDVIIDIGFKSDGVVSKNEFSEEVKPGDEVDVYLERMENYHGQLVLSRERAEEIQHWQQVEHAFENGTVLEGTIIRRIKGGMIVDLFKGLEAFLPGSQIDMRPVRDFDSYLGRKMEFKIVKISPENQNVVVSHKALIERELASQRESILATMEKGQVLKGIAKNITDFGVFVDLGGVDGLLHITDLTWGRVSHPTEVISLDQELKVVVMEYDKERQRISLGLKQLQPNPWDSIEERYKPGDAVEGKVVSIMDYGAFLELEEGIEGLVHVSEMSWTGNIRHPSQRVSLGQIVKVEVLSIDHDLKKISLGMKQFDVNPWEGLATRYPPGTILRGAVRNITHFGVFVEIEKGIDGLVHASDLSWTKTIRHPSELIKKNQELSVVVLDVDEKRQRIALGHKQIETNPWANLATVYAVGTDHQGKIVHLDRKGLTVELPYDVEAFVPVKELKNQVDSGFPPYQEGDELELRVIRLDVEKKELTMSETAKTRQEESKARRKEQDSKRAERREEEKAVRRHTRQEQISSGPTTIGELSGLESPKEKLADKKAKPKAGDSKVTDGDQTETELKTAEEDVVSDTDGTETVSRGDVNDGGEAETELKTAEEDVVSDTDGAETVSKGDVNDGGEAETEAAPESESESAVTDDDASSDNDPEVPAEEETNKSDTSDASQT